MKSSKSEKETHKATPPRQAATHYERARESERKLSLSDYDTGREEAEARAKVLERMLQKAEERVALVESKRKEASMRAREADKKRNEAEEKIAEAEIKAKQAESKREAAEKKQKEAENVLQEIEAKLKETEKKREESDQRTRVAEQKAKFFEERYEKLVEELEETQAEALVVGLRAVERVKIAEAESRRAKAALAQALGAPQNPLAGVPVIHSYPPPPPYYRLPTPHVILSGPPHSRSHSHAQADRRESSLSQACRTALTGPRVHTLTRSLSQTRGASIFLLLIHTQEREGR